MATRPMSVKRYEVCDANSRARKFGELSSEAIIRSAVDTVNEYRVAKAIETTVGFRQGMPCKTRAVSRQKRPHHI